MEKTMTPSGSEMTSGQIDKAVANYRALLEKHRSELGSEAAQFVIGSSEFAVEQADLFRKRVEAVSEIIVRRVRVNRSRTPQQALDATGRRQFVNADVVIGMPGQGGEEEVDVCFFPLRKLTSVADVQRALEERGLKPDAFAVAAVNEADPSFADSHPNATQWVDYAGRHCFVTFTRWGVSVSGRGVYCGRNGNHWSGKWWLGGVCK